MARKSLTNPSVPPATAADHAVQKADLDAHINETVDAHDASAISYAGSTSLAATDVEAALDELDTEKRDATAPVAIPHTFAVGGEIKVAVGDTDYIPPFFVHVPAGRTAKLVGCKDRINSGTSVTYSLQQNGVDITGFTGLSATTTASAEDPTDVTLADGDMLALVVTAVSGTPKNLSVSLFVEYT